MSDIWQFTENAPDYATDVAELWHWSTNYDAGKGPFTMFLDLIGWSEDNIGSPLYSFEYGAFGYVELDKLADALKQYTARPSDVMVWVEELLNFEEA